VKSSGAKLKPINVTSPAPVLAILAVFTNVSTGLSNENCPVCVPTTAASVMLREVLRPVPGGVVQEIAVSEDHIVVRQIVDPSRAVPDRSEEPKLKPKTDTEERRVAMSIAGAFVALIKVTTGESYVNALDVVPTIDEMIAIISLVPIPTALAHFTDENVDQLEVKQAVSPTINVGV
jgi:hypothetical protein